MRQCLSLQIEELRGGTNEEVEGSEGFEDVEEEDETVLDFLIRLASCLSESEPEETLLTRAMTCVNEIRLMNTAVARHMVECCVDIEAVRGGPTASTDEKTR